MTESAASILVVGPSWVGDMVMSQVLYKHLRQSQPGCLIDVLAPAWSRPLLQRMPEVRRAITMPLGHGEFGLGRRRALGHKLRAESYDRAIVLPNSLKSSLVPWFARIPVRTGWRGEMRYGLLNDLRVLDAQTLPLMVQRFLALGMSPGADLPEQLPSPGLQVDPDSARLTGREFGLDADAPVLALCPGAEFGAAKRWPTDYYAELARCYLHKGWQVALFGSANDRQVCADIYRDCDSAAACHDLAGQTSLDQAVELLSLSRAVVSNDSGLMHIVAALGRPLLAIYGATSPAFTPPLSNAARVLQSDIDCAPCFERDCPLGHHRCMVDTAPPRVLEHLQRLLQEERGEP